MRPIELEDLRAVLQKMSGSAADAVALAKTVPDMLRRLPPPAAQLMSRPHFERATLWSYVADFEDVRPDGETTPQVIRIQKDCWIRGVQVQVYAGFPIEDPDLVNLVGLWATLQGLSDAYGNNNRALVELNWRIDSAQGFISTGTSETLERAALIAGDGQFSAALDWRLQTEQTIEVRCRSLIRDFFPVALLSDAEATLRWVVVTFWGEQLEQPSVR